MTSAAVKPDSADANKVTVWSGSSPVNDEVVPHSGIRGRLVGCPAGAGHQGHQGPVQTISLQLHPDLLIQPHFRVRSNEVGASRVVVGVHRHSVIPNSSFNLLHHGAGKHGRTPLPPTSSRQHTNQQRLPTHPFLILKEALWGCGAV